MENFRKLVRKIIKEWYDEEYFHKPEPSSGIGAFANIDWEMLFDSIKSNTEILKDKSRTGNTFNVGDFVDPGDYDGLLTGDELKLLEDAGLIYIWDGFPIIDEDKYLDFNAFREGAKNAWLSFPNHQVEKQDKPEAPYLRGREEQQD